MAKEDLMPPVRSKDDPRYIKMQEGREAYWKRYGEKKARRESYKEQIHKFKQEQFETAQENMENGVIESPIDLLTSMIAEQKIAVANPDLNRKELMEEKKLLNDLLKQYSVMTGANAPNSQSLEVDGQMKQEMSAEEAMAILVKAKNGLSD